MAKRQSDRSRQAKAEHIRQVIASDGEAMAGNTQGYNQGRYESTARLEGYESLKDEARAIKERAIENLPTLLDELEATVEANGGHVYRAEDAADACEYVRSVAEDCDAETVVKSKSMTTEEIDLNEALVGDGHSAGAGDAGGQEREVWETDFAEFILQIAEEEPSHIVTPAAHKSREEISALFNEYFDPDEPLESAEDLTAFAREFLAERYREADLAVTGANFLTADTGSMALVTSEGNARKAVASTDTHVAVAGIEKVLPSFSELQPFIELIGRSGTGQDITSYVSLLTPPVDSPTLDWDAPDAPLGDSEERDFHLVLLDNGRWEMREDPQLRETLYCIRCSACLNSCANFQQVGGHSFGGETYSGGIATGWEAGVHGQDSAAEFNDHCTGCSRCVNQCPVRIDIPWINTVVRDRVNRGKDPSAFDNLVDGLTPDEEPAGIDVQKRLFGHFETLANLGSATAPVSNWLPKLPGARTAMEHTVGLDRRRDLPQFQRRTLRKWFQGRGKAQVPPGEARREVVLYPDVYTNHVQVERGKAAVELLEALDVHVTMPALGSSGRAPYSQGMLATAREKATTLLDGAQEHLEAGRDVVFAEPSDLHMIREDYENLLGEGASEETLAEWKRLREHSYDLMAYAYGLLEHGAEPTGLDGGDDTSVFYHAHCQQRTLDLEAHTVAVLEACGYDVTTSEVECCGMAGSFGYKTEYYDLAMAVGDDLAEQVTAADPDVVAASGTSCLEQLEGMDFEPIHPAALCVGRFD